MAAAELQFHVQDFDGPLALLLALAAKRKMDLHEISILELIDQYTRTVEAAQAEDPDLASAFIEMAAHLVEMKSYLLLPRSAEGERMKQELTGRLIEYDQCRRLAAQLRAQAGGVAHFVRRPEQLAWDTTYALHHAPQLLADCWHALSGRAPQRPPPTQQEFEPIVSAPQVSVASRVVHILRGLVGGSCTRLEQLFSRKAPRGANVATFLALLELVRGGRVRLGPAGELSMRRGHLPRGKKETP